MSCEPPSLFNKNMHCQFVIPLLITVKIWLKWTNYHSFQSSCDWSQSNTTDPEPAEAKTCHFRRHKHDIMMPKATLGSSSISWNVFKLWLSPRHAKKQSLFSHKKHTFCGAQECHSSLQNIWLIKWNIKKWKQRVRALNVCFHFCLFVFCVFFPGVRHSWALTKLSVTWLKSSGFMWTCYTSHLWLKPELTRQPSWSDSIQMLW